MSVTQEKAAPPQTHTPGAMRAARKAIDWYRSDSPGFPFELAEIIDRETGAKELLEALERLTGMIRDCRNVYQNHAADWMMEKDTYRLAESAIAKARGRQL